MSIVISDIKNPYTTSGSITNWTYLADIRNISNMYPYGKSYPATTTYSADDDYRYGFNGKEKEKSFDSDGDVADFGARIFDANYPVFLSRDPLETSFANQSSYIFASNTPIQAIDYNGENTFFVMGTNYEPKDNAHPKLQETVNYLHNTLSNSTGEVDYGFSWSDKNDLTNSYNEWLEAGKELGEYALANNNGDDDITFIGYSYGGAVSTVAANYIYKKTEGKVKVNIITIATPANNYVMKKEFLNYKNSKYPGLRNIYEGAKLKSTGNPEYSKGINDMMHFYVLEDDVAGFFARDDYYSSSKVDNYLLDSRDAPWNSNTWELLWNSFSSHMDIIYYKNIFQKTIEKNNIPKQAKTREKNEESGKTE